MKKLFAVILIFLFILPFVFSAETLWDEEDEDPFKEKGSYRIPNRIFEFGVNVSGGFSNNVLTFSEILSEDLVLNIDNLTDGFIFNLGFDVTPFFMRINKEKWGFGVFSNINFDGVFSLSGDMLSVAEAIDSKSELCGTAFLEAGVNTYFYIKNFKIKFTPAVYYPVIYMQTDISYTFDNVEKGTILDIGYDMRMYTPFPMNDFDSLPSDFKPTAKPGIDFYAGLEYPISKALGFSSRLLTFDIGLDLFSIPIYRATVRDYLNMSANIGSLDPVDIVDDGFDTLFSSFDFRAIGYGEEDKKIIRPFKTHLWLSWRPLGREVITIKPLIGFSINPIYSKVFYIDAGITGIFDFANAFVIALGFNYIDRIWRNSLDFAFNCRAFELNIGVDLRSQSFVRSWNANGLGFNFGIKFGW